MTTPNGGSACMAAASPDGKGKMRSRGSALWGLLFVLVVLPSVCTAAAILTVSDVLRDKIETLGSSTGSRIQGETIAAPNAVVRFYENRHFRPAWAEPSHVRAMMAAIHGAQAHGLTPNHYHLQTLARLLDAMPQTKATAKRLGGYHGIDLDILLTDSFCRLAHDFQFGRVNPVRFNPSWNFRSVARAVDLPALLQAALDDGRIWQSLDELAPAHSFYRRLRTALARYRRIAANGGWSPIPKGPRLAVGVRDVRVPLLRERLKRSGDLVSDTEGDPLVCEPSLGRAVLRFQERTRVDRGNMRGEDDAGVAGEATLEALNVPAEVRLQQLRVNLERCRWLFHDLPVSFVLVDLAGYRGYFYKEQEIIWRARVQVGKPYLETPSFRAAIKYVVFNPTWTVPPGILSRRILPKIRQDLNYLTSQHMRVIDRDGRLVDPTTVDWGRYSGTNLPYRIVQSPGVHNAVGRVKFIMPNKHLIFLHDTPHKSKFGLNDRAFSAGCIRVDKPLKLAKRLLDGQERWTIGRIRGILATHQTQTFFLPEPMPVLLIYLTAMVDDQGETHFRQDVYNRDAAVIEALDQPLLP